MPQAGRPNGKIRCVCLRLSSRRTRGSRRSTSGWGRPPQAWRLARTAASPLAYIIYASTGDNASPALSNYQFRTRASPAPKVRNRSMPRVPATAIGAPAADRFLDASGHWQAAFFGRVPERGAALDAKADSPPVQSNQIDAVCGGNRTPGIASTTAAPSGHALEIKSEKSPRHPDSASTTNSFSSANGRRRAWSPLINPASSGRSSTIPYSASPWPEVDISRRAGYNQAHRRRRALAGDLTHTHRLAIPPAFSV